MGKLWDVYSGLKFDVCSTFGGVMMYTVSYHVQPASSKIQRYYKSTLEYVLQQSMS